MWLSYCSVDTKICQRQVLNMFILNGVEFAILLFYGIIVKVLKPTLDICQMK